MNENKIGRYEYYVNEFTGKCKASKTINNKHLLQFEEDTNQDKSNDTEESKFQSYNSNYSSQGTLKENMNINDDFTVVSEEFFKFLTKTYINFLDHKNVPLTQWKYK